MMATITAVLIPATTDRLTTRIDLPDANRTAWAEAIGALHISKKPCRYTPEAAMIIDGNGFSTYRPWNPRASRIAGRVIMGDALIIGLDSETAINLPTWIIDDLLQAVRG